MSDIQKNCWIKETKYKVFGKKIFSVSETLDCSEFSRPEASSFYSIPKVFQNNKD